MTRRIPGAEKPSGSKPNLFVWLGVYLAVIAGAAVLVEAYPKQGLAWVVVVGPLCLGSAQAAALWRSLPIWGTVLWPVATALGGIVSMSSAWFMYWLMGLGFGGFQAGLLRAGHFRGWFLWPLVSGLSWGCALLASSMISPMISGSPGPNAVSNRVGWVLVLVCYSVSTGLALHWMGRRPPRLSGPGE